MSYVLDFIPLSIAILSVSDTRSEDNDISGNLLAKNIYRKYRHLYALENSLTVFVSLVEFANEPDAKVHR